MAQERRQDAQQVACQGYWQADEVAEVEAQARQRCARNPSQAGVTARMALVGILQRCCKGVPRHDLAQAEQASILGLVPVKRHCGWLCAFAWLLSVQIYQKLGGRLESCA